MNKKALALAVSAFQPSENHSEPRKGFLQKKLATDILSIEKFYGKMDYGIIQP